MRSNLTSLTGYFEQTVPRYLLYEFEHHFRMTKRTFQILSGNRSSLRAVNSQNIHLACEAATDLLQLHIDVQVTPIDPLLAIHKSCDD